MSTELKSVEDLNGEVLMSSYWGGKKNGTCVQLTPVLPNPFLQLNKTMALQLAAALIEFATDERPEKED